MNRVTYLLAGVVVVALSVATYVFAQKEEEKLQPAEKKTANQQDSAMASSYLFAIRDPDLHRELRLSRSQVVAIQKVTDEIDGPLWSIRNKSAKEGTQILLKLVVQAEDGISEILTPSKRVRLKEIILQMQGPKAIFSSSVSEKLKLTSDQTAEIREIIEEAAKSLAGIQKEILAAKSDSARKSLNKKSEGVRSDEKKDILAVLTRTQKTEWTSMLGRAVDTSKMGDDIAFKAPEFVETGSWVNSQPIQLADLKGEVVAVHFYAFQ